MRLFVIGVALLFPLTLVAEVQGISAAAQLDMQRRLELVTQIQQLQGDLRELRGALEENQHTVENLKRRQREFYLDLDRRLIDLETQPRQGSASPLSTSGQEGVSADSVVKPVTEPQVGGGSPAELKLLEQQAYQQAFDLLKAARFEESITAFRKFLQLYPDGDYADNAQYWVGEAYYVTRNFDQALKEFGQLLEQFPDSGKRADTQLKIGYIYYEQEKWSEARQLLTQVAESSAAGTAAHLAQNRLKRMSEEGH